MWKDVQIRKRILCGNQWWIIDLLEVSFSQTGFEISLHNLYKKINIFSDARWLRSSVGRLNTWKVIRLGSLVWWKKEIVRPKSLTNRELLKCLLSTKVEYFGSCACSVLCYIHKRHYYCYVKYFFKSCQCLDNYLHNFACNEKAMRYDIIMTVNRVKFFWIFCLHDVQCQDKI